MQDMARGYLSRDNKWLADLLTTGGSAGQFVFSLISNNAQITWDELRVTLKEYYEQVSDPNTRIVKLANIKQVRSEGIQD